MALRKFVLILATAAMFGCAQNQPYIEARNMVESGNVEEGLARMEEESRKNPGDMEMKNYLARQKAMAVQRDLSAGDTARSQGQLDAAEQAYKQAQRFDAGNARAKEGLAGLAKDRAAQARLGEATAALDKGDSEQALAQAKEVLKDHPQQKDAKKIVRKVEEKKAKEEPLQPKLNAALKKPITLEFRDAPLRQVFEIISRQTGLNFIFDKDVPADARATIFVKETSIDEAMRIMLVTNQLDRKVLNENSPVGEGGCSTSRRSQRKSRPNFSEWFPFCQEKASNTWVTSVRKREAVFAGDPSCWKPLIAKVGRVFWKAAPFGAPGKLSASLNSVALRLMLRRV